MDTNDFTRVIDKAIAELGVAKTLGPQHAQAALAQARYHINLALDDARRKSQEPGCQPTTQTQQP